MIDIKNDVIKSTFHKSKVAIDDRCTPVFTIKVDHLTTCEDIDKTTKV